MTQPQQPQQESIMGMLAEHTVSLQDNTDALSLNGVWVTLTADEAGAVIVRLTHLQNVPFILMLEDDILIDTCPPPAEHQAMIEVAREAMRHKPFAERLAAAVKERARNDHNTDPMQMVTEEAAKLLQSESSAI